MESIVYASEVGDAVFKLTNFHLAKQLSDIPQYFNYRAAEITIYSAIEAFRKEQITSASDVWSVGALLYALLSGQLPFGDNKNSKDFKLRIKESSYFELPDTISFSARALIDMAFNQVAKSRITAEEALQHGWFKENDGSLKQCDLSDSLSHLHRIDLFARVRKAIFRAHVVSIFNTIATEAKLGTKRKRNPGPYSQAFELTEDEQRQRLRYEENQGRDADQITQIDESNESISSMMDTQSSNI
jgi:serine/threonine protein kinase